MTQDPPLLAVQEALKKCFPVVEEQQGLWLSTLRDCQPLLASLGNLAEQLQAAHNLRFEDVPSLRAFPDLKERLRRKQLEAGDTVLDKNTLLKVRDTVSSHVERVLQIYEQHADTVGIDAVLQASVVSPSVADMLEWLQDMERHYRNSYLKRKYLLSSIQWGDLANIQALPKAWDQLPEDEHQELVQGAVSFSSPIAVVYSGDRVTGSCGFRCPVSGEVAYCISLAWEQAGIQRTRIIIAPCLSGKTKGLLSVF